MQRDSRNSLNQDIKTCEKTGENRFSSRAQEYMRWLDSAYREIMEIREKYRKELSGKR